MDVGASIFSWQQRLRLARLFLWLPITPATRNPKLRETSCVPPAHHRESNRPTLWPTCRVLCRYRTVEWTEGLASVRFLFRGYASRHCPCTAPWPGYVSFSDASQAAHRLLLKFRLLGRTTRELLNAARCAESRAHAGLPGCGSRIFPSNCSKSR